MRGWRCEMKYYKLTNRDHTTYAGQVWWTPDEWNDAEPGKCKPCSSTALHGYTTPELAVLLNPIHGDYQDPLLWECE